MKDPRIEIPSGLRNAGIMGSLLMIALGLWIAWKQADQDIVLEPTGYKPPPKGPSSFDRLIEALTNWLNGKKEG
jgi:hypothetical protein